MPRHNNIALRVRSRPHARSRSGFTLIEIILVIAVMLLAMTALVPLLSDRSDEHALKSAADSLERFARMARAEAAYRGAASHVSIGPGGFALHVTERAAESAAVAADEGFFFDEVAGGDARFTVGEGEAPGMVESHELPKGVVVKLRPWLATRWSQPDAYEWGFDPSGLCEPLSVRLEAGDSWIELAFSPLTAQVREESYAFP